MGCKEEQRLERMSGPLLIRARTESPGPGVGGQQAPPDRLGANRYLPVWAAADNTPRESAAHLKDLVKA